MTSLNQPDVCNLALTTWERLPLLSASAARQMAIDATLARLCEIGRPRAFFRLYRMNPPAVTIGRHQRWRSVIDEGICRRQGWEWARRPTGGGALLHRCEINYAVAASHAVFGGDASFNHAYRCIMSGLAAAIELLGAHPTLNMGRHSVPASSAPSARGLCQQSLTHFEIAVDGQKAVAAAQWHSADAVLQHGTIYLQAPGPTDRFWPLDAQDRTSRIHAPRWWDTADRVTLSDEGLDLVADAVRDGLARALHLSWTETDYNRIDSQLIEAQLHDWISRDWNHHR